MIKSHAQLNKCKTRDSRWKNRMADRLNNMLTRRWTGVVPKSVALMNHCKQRNYGRNTAGEQQRRMVQDMLAGRTEIHLFTKEDYNNEA